MKTANVDALPDSLDARRAQQQVEQERLLALEREEAALRNQRATVVWVFERTGRSATVELSPEEEELEALRASCASSGRSTRRRARRSGCSRRRIAALEGLVEEQRSARAIARRRGQRRPGAVRSRRRARADRRPARRSSRQEKALIEATLAELDASIQATPGNEMVLAGLERELANLEGQYEAACANLGQAAIGERIEVLSKGERFSLIEPPTEPTAPDSPNRVLIASAGVVGGGRPRARLRRAARAAEPLDPPARRRSPSGSAPSPSRRIPYIRTRAERRWKRSVIVGRAARRSWWRSRWGCFAVHTLRPAARQPADGARGAAARALPEAAPARGPPAARTRA